MSLLNHSLSFSFRSVTMRISPKSFVTLSVLAAGLLGASSPAHAAFVTTWAAGTFTGNAILDGSVLPGKTLLYADDTFGGAITTNGVPFTRNNNNVTYLTNSSEPGQYNLFLTGTTSPLDANFDTILTSAFYAGGSGAKSTVATLKGLTSGDTYGVLFLAIDSRESTNGRTIQVNDGTTSSPDQRYAWYSDNIIKGGYVTATFTADSATQAFNIKGYEGLVSAIVVYGPTVVEVPEPASLGLLSLGGLALLARRRQK